MTSGVLPARKSKHLLRVYEVQHHDVQFPLQQARVAHYSLHTAHLFARRKVVIGIVHGRFFEQQIHRAARENIARYEY